MSYTASYIVNSSSAQGTTDFQFTFPYIKEEHIEVFLNYNKITQGSGSNQFQVITNVSPKLIRLNTGIASANLRVEVRRNSSLGTPLVDYADGSTLTANDLDTSALQSLYIDQELKDNQGKTVSVDEATGLPSMGESGTNLRLTNVADPTAAQDAATKNYVDTKVFTSAQIQDGTIVNADVNASAAIDGTKINPNFGSQNIVTTGTVDGRDVSVDGAKLDTCDTNAKDDQTAAEIRVLVGSASDSNVFTDALKNKLDSCDTGAKDDQTAAEIRTLVGSASDSNVFTDALKNKLDSCDTGAKDDQTAAEIKTLIASSPLDASHLAPNSVTTSEIADAELTTLAGMQSGTASILASSTALTATNAEINTVCDGKSVQTTISDTDNSYPTSGAVVDYVAAQIAPLGGLEVIANEDSFPTQPASGVVISIADAGGIVVNGSGVSTTARTSGNGSDNVTINGFPSTLHSTTLTDNMGLLVSSTGSSNTYTYHKLLGKESDIKSLSDDINDFNNRYRVAASAPSSSLDDGDLWFDTTNDKMKVYNATGSSWDDVATVGDFFINTLSSSGNTGGGSATFNGTAYRFVLSSPPASAQQLIVSVNGVIQKPNAGSSQPSEGFAVSGNDIIFSAAPPSGADYFITTQGSAVSIGTPSDNTVSTAKIQNLAVTGDKIATNLDLADNKKIRFGTGNDLQIYHNGSQAILDNDTGDTYIKAAGMISLNPANTEDGALIKANGAVELMYDNSKKAETASWGLNVLGNCGVGDSSKFQCGDSQDLQIYHDGSNSYIKNNTSNLCLLNSGVDNKSISFYGDAGLNEHLAHFIQGADCRLYYDNVKRFETNAYGVKVNGHIYADDTHKVQLGSSQDLQIYHDGSHNHIRHGVANQNLYIEGVDNESATPFIYLNPRRNQTGLSVKANQGVDLYYDNVKKFETGSYGAQITGDLYITNELNLGGDGDEHKYLDAQVGTNAFHIRKTTGGDTGHEFMALFRGDAECAFYYNGTTRAYTTDHGWEGWKSSTCFGRIGTSNSGHYFVAQSDDSTPAFEIYQQHGSNTTRNSLAVYDNRTGSKSLAFYVRGDGETFSHPNDLSDRALKDNITDMATSYTKIKNLRPVNFTWKNRVDTEGNPVSKSISGFIAQEVEEQIPNIINGEEGSKGINSAGLVAHLTKALQEAITKIETLETKVAALESA